MVKDIVQIGSFSSLDKIKPSIDINDQEIYHKIETKTISHSLNDDIQQSIGQIQRICEVTNGVKSMLKSNIKKMSKDYINHEGASSFSNLNLISDPIKEMLDKTMMKNHTKSRRR